MCIRLCIIEHCLQHCFLHLIHIWIYMCMYPYYICNVHTFMYLWTLSPTLLSTPITYTYICTHIIYIMCIRSCMDIFCVKHICIHDNCLQHRFAHLICIYIYIHACKYFTYIMYVYFSQYVHHYTIYVVGHCLQHRFVHLIYTYMYIHVHILRI